MMEQGHGDAPMSHGAGRIFSGDVLKCLAGVGISEGMQKRYTAVEFCLYGRGAGDAEGDLAQIFGNAKVVRILRQQARAETSQNQNRSAESRQIGPPGIPT